MKFLTASEDTGSIKEIVCSRGTDTSKQDATQPTSITNICNEEGASLKTRVLQMEVTGDVLVASRLGGTLCVYDLNSETYDLLHVYTFEGLSKEDKSVSLVEDKKSDVIIVAFESGKVFLVNLNDKKFDLPPISLSLPTNKQISCLTMHPTQAGIIACGGKENDAQVIKLYEGTISHALFKSEKKAAKFFKPVVLFTAKNVKNNHLDLRSPIWIRKILFLDSAKPQGYDFLTVTRYGQLRIYDTTHGKRPIKDYPICDKAILEVGYTSAEQDDIVVTDTHGLLAKFSLTAVDEKAYKTNSASAGKVVKPVAKLLGKYTGGNTGAIYGLDVVNDLLASGGLDRYLRVYDVQSREVVAKVYIGTQINEVIILDDEDEVDENEVVEPKRTREQIEEDAEKEEEELWNQLGDVAEDEQPKKKRRV
ncbi:ribosome biogenesis protein Nsa1p [[Candida] anglica]